MWWVPEVWLCELLLSDLLSPFILSHVGLSVPGLSLEGTLLTGPEKTVFCTEVPVKTSTHPHPPRPGHHTTHPLGTEKASEPCRTDALILTEIPGGLRVPQCSENWCSGTPGTGRNLTANPYYLVSHKSPQCEKMVVTPGQVPPERVPSERGRGQERQQSA